MAAGLEEPALDEKHDKGSCVHLSKLLQPSRGKTSRSQGATARQVSLTSYRDARKDGAAQACSKCRLLGRVVCVSVERNIDW